MTVKNDQFFLLSRLLGSIDYMVMHGFSEKKISGLSHDSRTCKPGYIFFAASGCHVNGHDYIDKAIANGASTVIHTERISIFAEGVCYIQLQDVKRAMSRLSAEFYDNPSGKIPVIGVTGTDGKSSTCFFLYQLLQNNGYKPALFSSVWKDSGKGIRENSTHLTTPDAIEIHKFLAEAIADGCRTAVIEASSHGLSPATGRLLDISFSLAVCTDITSDHLDFHGSRAAYIDAKMNIFRQLIPGGSALVPVHADWRPALEAVIGDDQKIRSWSVELPDKHGIASVLKPNLSIVIENFSSTGIEVSILSDTFSWAGKLPFVFFTQVKNFAAALLAYLEFCIGRFPLKTLSFNTMEAVKGRFKLLSAGENGTILFDYAHTEHAFLNVFSDMRRLYPDSRFIAVFGSPGERDASKRVNLGRIAAEYCDIVILTEDDSRSEDTTGIIKEIKSGIPDSYKGTILIDTDRRSAIVKALRNSTPESCILLLGKGHEKTIERRNHSVPWDEEAVVREALSAVRRKPYA
ncbi:MAG: UDP-N-acetylmuramyl-tripeptide synthetase [Spirochaetia bacterium]|nr:UDP-N-acetylmuramyl-tripeptide synthetase [Spirochaetia bacterium]